MKLSMGVVRHPKKLTSLAVQLKYKKASKKKRYFQRQIEFKSLFEKQNARAHECRELTAAWRRLENCKFNEECLVDILTVTSSTIGIYFKQLEKVPERITDWNALAILNDREQLRALLIRLAPFWDRAVKKLSISKPLKRHLLNHKPSAESVIDPFYLIQHGFEVELDEMELSSDFCYLILPWLKNRSRLELLKLENMCERLARVHDYEDLALLVSLAKDEEIEFLLDAVSLLEKENLHYFLMALEKVKRRNQALKESYRYAVAAAQRYLPVTKLTKMKFFNEVLNDMYRRPAQMISDGFDFARALDINYSEVYLHGAPKDVWQLLAIIGTFQEVNNESATNFFATQLGSIHISIIGRLLKRSELPDKVKWKLIDSIYYEDDRLCKLSIERFSEIIEYSFKVLEELTLKYQKPYAETMSYVFEHVSEKYCIYEVEEKLYRVIHSIEDGQANRGQAYKIRQFWVTFPEEIRSLVLDLPKSSMKHVRDVFRTYFRAEMLNQGLSRFIENFSAGLAVSFFRYLPKGFCELLIQLAQLPENRIKDVVEVFVEAPLYGDFNVENTGERNALLEIVQLEGLRTPKRLELLSRDGVRKEIRQKILDEISHLRCALLLKELNYLITSIKKNVFGHIESDIDHHTLSLGMSSDYNRRVFRKVIRRFDTQKDWSVNYHPENKKWLASRKFFWRPAAWLNGVKENHIVEKYGELTFFTEHNPHEVMKMGSYVNSCLALGNMNSHSAIANAFDINKQVIYVRNQKGDFIARQLLAISEEGDLVCFHIYSNRVISEELKKAFSKVNKHFASQLGIEICKKEGYSIKPTVCREWYDDGMWNAAG